MKRQRIFFFACGVFFCLFSLACTCAWAQTQAPEPAKIPDGVQKSFFPDGKLQIESTFKDGKLNGISKEYYPDGKVKLEVEYKDGKRDGIYHSNYEDGTLWSDGFFKDDRPRGLMRGYFPGGDVMGEWFYNENGELDTKAFMFFQGGPV